MKKIIALTIAVLLIASGAMADEMLALYGLKGYAYTYSPLIVQGAYIQTGGIYSLFSSIDNQEGYTWAVPLSLTYGNGEWWEASIATHWEYWKNTDYAVNESGMGDVFVGGKFRLIGSSKDAPLDISLMPYLLIPVNHDKSIGDLYPFNTITENDMSYGINLLLGKRWERFYLSANIGINYTDTDVAYTKTSSLFLGLALEYQISESWDSYIEFVNIENKNDYGCSPCYDQTADEDRREIGLGIVWLKNYWGFKLHAGIGLTDTAPDFQVIGLVNLNL